MRRQSVFFQLILTLLLLLGIAIASTGYYGVRSLRLYAEKDAARRQWELVRTLSVLFEIRSGETPEEAALRFLSPFGEPPGYRITIIAPDGKVLGDTHEDPKTMDNHRSRPEVRAAMSGGRGDSIRQSETLAGESLIYTAFYDTTHDLVFRVARTVRDLQEGMNRSVRGLTLFALVLALISVLVSILAARRVSRLLHAVGNVADHFADGDFSTSLNLSGFREADELSRSMNRMGRQLKETIRDLQLRRHELQSMLEGMTAPVVLLDQSLDIREINPAAVALAGREADQCRGRSLLQIFRSPELYDLARALLDGEDVRESQIRIDRPAGTVYLQVLASRISAGCLLVMNDITRISQLEQMRKDFVANVSHELRTPITSILGFVETIQTSPHLDSSRRDGFLSIIRRQAVRLDHIISDLMVLSRLEEGETTLPRDVVQVRHLFEGAVETCSLVAESRSISVQIEVPDGLECCVYPILAEQAVVNLLDNAVKYSPEGSRVHLTARAADDEVILEVIDEGPGLPESELTRVYERFHRVDKARSREMGGTGLGLAIVKHIALKHGGRTWVESRYGQGCTFRIAFPAGGCGETESTVS